jgi:phosphate transport system substrate-binding protein
MFPKALLKPAAPPLAVMTKAIFLFAALVSMIAPYSAQALDPSLPTYRPLETLSGNLRSVGSDTLGHEMESWANGFEKVYPDVRMQVEAAGSATAPSALLDGRAQFGPMSRPMTAEEIAAFKTKYGYDVSRFRVALDALAVYVNKDNPIACLTLPQLSGIFSSNRMTPGGADIRTWGDLGLKGDWARHSITLYSRNTLSGTYEYFRETALYGGEYKPEIKQQPGSDALVQSITADTYGIGYSGIGFKAEGVRAVPLASYYGGTCYEASAEATFSGKYPIARYLYIYLNKKPNQSLDPLRTEFVKYILSKNGQEQTERGGFFPITNEIRDSDLSKLGITPGS